MLATSYDITAEISKKTGGLIDELNFQKLREYCLLRQPIDDVITKIEVELTEQHQRKLKIFEETSLNEAIEQQIIQDMADQNKDTLAITKLRDQKKEYLDKLNKIKSVTNTGEQNAKEGLAYELEKCEEEILNCTIRKEFRRLRSIEQSRGNERLSIKNSMALKQKIAVKQKQLADIQASWLKDARERSFSIYLAQLEIKTSNNCHDPQNQALLTIISAIKELLMVEDNLKNAQISCEKIMTNRKICIDIAQSKQHKIQQALEKLPNNIGPARLHSQAVFDAESNQLMEQNEALKASLTNKILIISMSFLAVLALGTVLLINGLTFGIVLPILLSIPTTALLITGIWAAVSYAFICNTLSCNEEKINEYHGFLDDLSEQIPQLITARLEYDRQISKLEEDITTLKNDFRILYEQALAVEPIANSPNNNPTSRLRFYPSAPPPPPPMPIAVPINGSPLVII